MICVCVGAVSEAGDGRKDELTSWRDLKMYSRVQVV